MGKTLMDIMAPEIRESNIRAAVDILVRHTHGDLEGALREVADRYGMTPDKVKAILDKAKANDTGKESKNSGTV